MTSNDRTRLADEMSMESRAIDHAAIRRRPPEYDEATAPEGTIIAKLAWAALGSSDRQLDDVAGILRVRGATLDTTYIERWVAALGLGRPVATRSRERARPR